MNRKNHKEFEEKGEKSPTTEAPRKPKTYKQKAPVNDVWHKDLKQAYTELTGKGYE